MSRKSIAAVAVIGVACLAPTAVEAQTAPDLQIGVVLVATSPTAFGPGPLQFAVGIRNTGDAASAATTLRYYRSSDATITTSDTELATEAVAAITASATLSGGSTVNRPSDAITYYYGVCVDAVAGESDTTNNCSAGLEIPTTDLVVDEPTMMDNAFGNLLSEAARTVAPMSTFTLAATVRNDGDAASAPTTLHYYRSTDATITTADTEEDTDAVAAVRGSPRSPTPAADGRRGR